MQLKKLHHVAVICSNYEVSKHFYTRILDLRVIQETYLAERDSYKLDLAIGEQSQIELFSFPNPPKRLAGPEARGLRHLAFEVKDLDSAIRELAAYDIPCEPVLIDPITDKRFTFFHDPDGLPLELYEIVSD